MIFLSRRNKIQKEGNKPSSKTNAVFFNGKIKYRLKCMFGPYLSKGCDFDSLFKKNYNFGPFRSKIAEKTPRVPKKGS